MSRFEKLGEALGQLAFGDDGGERAARSLLPWQFESNVGRGRPATCRRGDTTASPHAGNHWISCAIPLRLNSVRETIPSGVGCVRGRTMAKHEGGYDYTRYRKLLAEAVDEAILRIEEKLLASGEKEVVTSHLGELVMRELKKLDKIAYIRFASVYRSFEDVSEFRDMLDEFQGNTPPKT